MSSFCIFVLLLMFSCQKEKTATVETIEGVEVIHNFKDPVPRRGIPSKIRFEEELSIGEVKGREEYMFSMIRGVAITPENQLAVDDMGNRTIKFFTLDGNYVKSFSTAKIRMYTRTMFSSEYNRESPGHVMNRKIQIHCPFFPIVELHFF